MTTHLHAGSLERWLRVVQDIIGKPTQGLSLLDLCCGECTGTSKLTWKEHVGVDLQDWKTRPSTVRFVQDDALFGTYKLAYKLESMFDVCLCSDGIEHINKPNGLRLLAEMRLIAKLAIIFTPLGSYLIEPDNRSQHAHKSGWLPEELEAMGWQTEVYPNWHPTLGVGAFFAHKGKLQL